MPRLRIVVADQAEAIFYDSVSLTARPTEVGRLADPEARLHARDLGSERPGRSYESVGGARHAIERENDPRQREAIRFAREIARSLEEARRSGEYEQLIVAAGPSFLGLLRAEISPATRACIVCELHKDLVHSPPGSLLQHLPSSLAGLKSA
jgi:protein required for attachment to host cells